MDTNTILYIIGLVFSIILGIASGVVIFFKYQNRGFNSSSMKTKEQHLSKVVLKYFSVWLVTFFAFLSVVLFIFCVTMLAV